MFKQHVLANSKLQAMGIHFRVLCAIEQNPAAIQYISLNFPEVEHIFTDFIDFVYSDTPFCWKCQCRHSRPAESSDLQIGGMPCHAWSRMRWKKGETAYTQSADKHLEWSLLEAYAEYQDVRKPGIFLIEEVEEFAKAMGPAGKTADEVLVENSVRRGYAIRRFKQLSSLWVKMPRTRSLLHMRGRWGMDPLHKEGC